MAGWLRLADYGWLMTSVAGSAVASKLSTLQAE
jgi:hypothetical protein